MMGGFGEGLERPMVEENHLEKAENMEELWQPGIKGVP